MKPSRTFLVIIVIVFAAFFFIVAKHKSGLRRLYYKHYPRSLLPNVHKTGHFKIYTNLGAESVQYYADFFEGFFDYFSGQYFEIGQKKHLNVYLFGDPYTYDTFVKTFEGYTPYGFYMGPADNIIVVNCDSGLGTTTHELVHHFIATSFETRPPKWIDEGIATFFEKFIGHLDVDGSLEISFGYFSNWRFPITKSMADRLSIRRLMASANPDQCAARSLMLFLHKKGLFRECIKGWKTAKDPSAAVEVLTAVYGSSLDDIESEWKAWVNAQPIDADVMLVQGAFVLTEPQWRQWWQSNQANLYWSEQEQIYRVKQTP
jgi:hypothetical protein